jgi:large subunit ribosomal protein L19
VAPPATILNGKNLMHHLSKTLPGPSAQKLLSTLFHPHHPDRLLPGSIISLTLAHAPTSFAGVLISVRHRGPDTSFTLRNVIQRTGVEMRFNVGSPHIKEVNVIQRASVKNNGSGRRTRRAKLFYLRDQPQKMSAVSAGVAKGK